MSLVVKFPKAKKSYRPSDALNSLIRDLLQYQKDEKKLDDKISAGGMKEEDIDKGKAELAKEKYNLDKRKVDVLNRHIFPAMANLTRLVEVMQKESYIRGTFDDDLRYLFLARASSGVNKDKSDKSIFKRFIEASCKMNTTIITQNVVGSDGKALQLVDYRLILCHIMQESICEAMRDIGPSKFGDKGFSENIMMRDLEYALAWTNQVSREASISEVSRGADAKLRFHKKRRPPQF